MTNFRVPFICKFKPGIPGIPVREDDYEDHYDEDPYHEPDLEEEEEMYGLKVQLLSEDDDEKRATLLETRSDSTTVFRDIKLHKYLTLFSPARPPLGTKST